MQMSPIQCFLAPFLLVKRLNRSVRKWVKKTFRPEVSKRKIRHFLNQVDRSAVLALQHPIEPTIAIVVPCYGHANQIPEMFVSICEQTRSADEVIFVVDKSPDNSGKLLEKLIATRVNSPSPSFQILYNHTNLGQAASINKAILHAKSDLIMILNDDDYLMHDCIEVVLDIFSRHPEASLVGGGALQFSSPHLNFLKKKIKEIQGKEPIQIEIRTPQDVKGYQGYNDLCMAHTSSCFYKSAWEIAGRYYSDKNKRVVPFSDRDFQLRMNALFTVALSVAIPLCCWRNDASVDEGLNS